MALVPWQGSVKAEEGHGVASGRIPWPHGRGYIQLASVVTLGRERGETAERQSGGGGRMGATRHARLLLLLLDERRASERAMATGAGGGGGDVGGGACLVLQAAESRATDGKLRRPLFVFVYGYVWI